MICFGTTKVPEAAKGSRTSIYVQKKGQYTLGTLKLRFEDSRDNIPRSKGASSRLIRS